jgi:hypothetical protein
MRHHPNPARPTQRCKIKRVNPAFRSVSTPRWTKDLPRSRSVNPTRELGTSRETASALEWSAERLRERLGIELAPRAWERLVAATKRRAATVDQLLRWGLSEVA